MADTAVEKHRKKEKKEKKRSLAANGIISKEQETPDAHDDSKQHAQIAEVSASEGKKKDKKRKHEVQEAEVDLAGKFIQPNSLYLRGVELSNVFIDSEGQKKKKKKRKVEEDNVESSANIASAKEAEEAEPSGQKDGEKKKKKRKHKDHKLETEVNGSENGEKMLLNTSEEDMAYNQAS